MCFYIAFGFTWIPVFKMDQSTYLIIYFVFLIHLVFSSILNDTGHFIVYFLLFLMIVFIKSNEPRSHFGPLTTSLVFQSCRLQNLLLFLLWRSNSATTVHFFQLFTLAANINLGMPKPIVEIIFKYSPIFYTAHFKFILGLPIWIASTVSSALG